MASMAQYFNDPDFSDVTVKFGDNEIKGHRMILSKGSAVLKKALAPDSPFQESKTGIYTIEDADPEAAECMLYYIYTAKYKLSNTPDPSDLAYWERHLNVAILADMYSIPRLENIAISSCLADINDRSGDDMDVPRLIERAAHYHDRDGKLARSISEKVEAQFVSLYPQADIQHWLDERPEKRDELIIENFDALMEMETFRDTLKKDGELTLRHLDRVHAAAKNQVDMNPPMRKAKKCPVNLKKKSRFSSSFGVNENDPCSECEEVKESWVCTHR